MRGLVLIAVIVSALAGCSRHADKLAQHADAIVSLGSTTSAIAAAWLAGSVSGTYARTALDSTYQLIEKERSSLASAPQMLIDPRGAEMSQTAEKLSRLVAQLIQDVGAADSAAARQHLSQIPAGSTGSK
jgi:hypothetical protein